MDKENFTIVLIGAGNLATNLGKALLNAGFRIVQVFSRTEESAFRLAGFLACDFTTSLDEIIAGADLYIVSITDRVFTELLPEIVEGKENSLFVHTAGSIPMDVWKDHISHYGVFYPLQTFSKEREVDFTKIPVFLEYIDQQDGKLLEMIAYSISRTVLYADSEQRRNLHLAAVFACNFTNHMYALANRITQQANLPFDVLLPLIDETAQKVHYLTPAEAQTGPTVRYDVNVISKHLELLAQEPELRELYEKISESIYKNAKRIGNEFNQL